jgi:hypothetical protein
VTLAVKGEAMRGNAEQLAKLEAMTRVGKPMLFKDKKTGIRDVWGEDRRRGIHYGW